MANQGNVPAEPQAPDKLEMLQRSIEGLRNVMAMQSSQLTAQPKMMEDLKEQCDMIERGS